MTFEVAPVLSFFEALYQKPPSKKRFEEYIHKLQGPTKGNLNFPIGGFNPMAKEHALQKIKELKSLQAENIIAETLNELNKKIKSDHSRTIKVILNLADDLKGGWTNRYTTDFDSKFKINALVTRNFCTPFFWTSEDYNPNLKKKEPYHTLIVLFTGFVIPN